MLSFLSRNERINQEKFMAIKDTRPVSSNQGELSDDQLDQVAGGQEEVKKMGTIVVTAKREQPAQAPVVKMGQIVVTAKREKESATQVASADATSKKN